MLRSGTTSYYQADGLGSLTSLSNPSGALANTYTYDSFGNLTTSTGSLTNSFRYTGREFDTETSLYYYRARYYDSATGRFISEDPGRYTPVNFYSYVGGDPIFWNDPLGLYKCAQGAICTFIPDLNQALLNFEKCVGHEVTITCGNDSHKPTDPHMRGEAVDIGHNSNPWLTRDAAEDCFKKSFPQGKRARAVR
jgi:RHS repeat-associated protein